MSLAVSTPCETSKTRPSLTSRQVVDILIIISFFTFLSYAEYISETVIRAGLIGQILVGIIYGVPLANILKHEWQETFMYLGYIGLILIIFEGGLTARLDLLKKNFMLSLVGATTGVVLPIGFSYLLLYLGFGYGAVETFIIGAALSTTSLGTTFAVISGAAKSVDLSQTRVGAILVSAAVIDDVTGLVMASVIHDLGQLTEPGASVNLGWLIGRPIVASAAMAILTPILSKWVFAPLFRGYIEYRFARYDHVSNIILMILVLSAFISIAAYAGTSVLFGAFLAGSFLTYLPSKHPEGPFVVLSREQGEREKDKSPTFAHTFECYCLDALRYILAPLFFASIGFAVPFLSLWTGKMIWRGVVYTLLMMVGKLLVGACILGWEMGGTLLHRLRSKHGKKNGECVEHGPTSSTPSLSDNPEKSTSPPNNANPTLTSALKSSLLPSLLLGLAMVARGEIGLLIIEIGFNNTEYVSQDGFLTAIWAILLNTIIGPIGVGVLVRYAGKRIAAGNWGSVPGTVGLAEKGNVREGEGGEEARPAVSPRVGGRAEERAGGSGLGMPVFMSGGGGPARG